MNGYVLRKGDLLTARDGVGLITKTTKNYIYYLFKGSVCRSKKKTIWEYHDIKNRVDIKYGSMRRRKKQRKMRTLDLHGVKHNDADEEIRKFLNFVELPCSIITGKSDEMKKIASSIVKEYGWDCYEKDEWNVGTLMVVEK